MGFCQRAEMGPKVDQKWVLGAKVGQNASKPTFAPTLNPLRHIHENPLFTQFKGGGNCFPKTALRQSRPSIIRGIRGNKKKQESTPTDEPPEFSPPRPLPWGSDVRPGKGVGVGLGFSCLELAEKGGNRASPRPSSKVSHDGFLLSEHVLGGHFGYFLFFFGLEGKGNSGATGRGGGSVRFLLKIPGEGGLSQKERGGGGREGVCGGSGGAKCICFAGPKFPPVLMALSAPIGYILPLKNARRPGAQLVCDTTPKGETRLRWGSCGRYSATSHNALENIDR